MRDDCGRVHLGKAKSVKRLFSRAGAERYVKSEPLYIILSELMQQCVCMYICMCVCVCAHRLYD